MTHNLSNCKPLAACFTTILLSAIALTSTGRGGSQSRLAGVWVSEDGRVSLELKGDGTYSYKVKYWTAPFMIHREALERKLLVDETGEWRVVETQENEQGIDRGNAVDQKTGTRWLKPFSEQNSLLPPSPWFYVETSPEAGFHLRNALGGPSPILRKQTQPRQGGKSR